MAWRLAEDTCTSGAILRQRPILYALFTEERDMKRIAWKASIMGGWIRLFSIHGELTVPDHYTHNNILQKVRNAVLKALKIEWRIL